MAETWLPAAASPSERTETGTMVTNDSVGNSPFASRYRRTAPPTTVSTVSLTVAPATIVLPRLKSASGKWVATMTR